ncbi:MAG: lpxK [Caulobacteraceae bacterium]|nr:lpxK [Caulobacteraceae bacterium]
MPDPATPTSQIDPRLLEVLVCPLTHGALVYDRKAQELVSKSARLAYPIRDGVPLMLPEEARELGEDE